MKQRIVSVVSGADFDNGKSFNALTNAFTVSVPLSQVDLIRHLDGVKCVRVSESQVSEKSVYNYKSKVSRSSDTPSTEPENDAQDDEHGCKKNSNELIVPEHAECRTGVLHIIYAHPVSNDRDPVTGLHVCSYEIFGKLIEDYDECPNQRINKSFHE